MHVFNGVSFFTYLFGQSSSSTMLLCNRFKQVCIYTGTKYGNFNLHQHWRKSSRPTAGARRSPFPQSTRVRRTHHQPLALAGTAPLTRRQHTTTVSERASEPIALLVRSLYFQNCPREPRFDCGDCNGAKTKTTPSRSSLVRVLQLPVAYEYYNHSDHDARCCC